MNNVFLIAFLVVTKTSSAEDKFPVSLPLKNWNFVMDCLYDKKYKESEETIFLIRDQLIPQLKEKQLIK